MKRLFLLFLPVLLTFGGCAGVDRQLYPPQSPSACRAIYIINHGWHTGIAIATADIAPRLWPEAMDLPGAAFLEVGWGDERFYRAEEVTTAMALRAVVFPTASVLHVVALPVAPPAHYGKMRVLRVPVSDAGLEALLLYIGESYQRDAAGRAVRLGPGLQENSAFYDARGTYVAWNTCNNWAARALRTTGFPITPATALTAGNLWSQVKEELPASDLCRDAR